MCPIQAKVACDRSPGRAGVGSQGCQRLDEPPKPNPTAPEGRQERIEVNHAQSYTCLHYHLIFSTKNRVPAITADLQTRLSDYLGGILRSEKSLLLAAGGMPDYVHLLCALSKELAVAEALRLLKADSSRWIHATFPLHHAFAWQAGYGAFAVSYSHLESVKRYLAGQAEHHRSTTFPEEFGAFLRTTSNSTSAISGIDHRWRPSCRPSRARTRCAAPRPRGWHPRLPTAAPPGRRTSNGASGSRHP
jgi:REP element-mobilizing transposase RayT